jgi:hypothetical protein
MIGRCHHFEVSDVHARLYAAGVVYVIPVSHATVDALVAEPVDGPLATEISRFPVTVLVYVAVPEDTVAHVTSQ